MVLVPPCGRGRRLSEWKRTPTVWPYVKEICGFSYAQKGERVNRVPNSIGGSTLRHHSCKKHPSLSLAGHTLHMGKWFHSFQSKWLAGMSTALHAPCSMLLCSLVSKENKGTVRLSLCEQQLLCSSGSLTCTALGTPEVIGSP